MSIGPGEGLNFDFDLGPERIYDPETVADYVIWPLVDELWWDDWRQNTFAGNANVSTRRGTHKGQKFDIAIRAFTDVWIDADDTKYTATDIELASVAVIEVESILEDDRRDMVLAAASNDSKQVQKYKRKTLLVKAAANYVFHSDGESGIESHQLVENNQGEVIWHLETTQKPPKIDEDNPDTVVLCDPMLREQDMELIEAGLYVFRAPRALIRALHEIKAHPIVS